MYDLAAYLLFTTAANFHSLAPSFSESLRLMYEQTPGSDRQLKDVAVRCASDHMGELMNQDHFVGLLTMVGEIAVDILRCESRNTRLSGSGSTKVLMFCISCKSEVEQCANKFGTRKHWHCRVCGPCRVCDPWY